MNRNRRRIAKMNAGLAAGMAAVICAIPVYGAEKGTQITKEETVYIHTDASGSQQQLIVSDWLKNAGKLDQVKDQSILKEISNVKGEETFSENGDELVWQTDGQDIYYQGNTGKKAPVSMELSYYLDGKKMSPEALKGQSGHLEIRITYKNHEKKEVEIDGRKEELYVPFVMLTGMALPNDTFSNIVIDNGKIISDGNKSFVLGFTMPGMKENLKVSEKEESLSLPESLKISADVHDFSMSSTFTLALSDLMEEMDLQDIKDLDSMQTALDSLEENALKLVKGTEELSEGAEDLSTGIDQYTRGADQLGAAIRTYLGENGELKGQVEEYTNGVNTAVQGISEYISGADALAEGVLNYMDGEQKLAAGAGELQTLQTGLKQIQTAVEQLSAAADGKTDGEGTQDLCVAAQMLADGTQALADGINSDTMQELLLQMKELVQTGKELIDTAQGMGYMVQGELVSSLESAAEELEKIQSAQQEITGFCSQIQGVLSEDQEKIAQAKAAASESRDAIGQSLEELTARQKELWETDPEAADALQPAIDTLNTAYHTADAVSSMSDLENLQEFEQPAIDGEKLREAVKTIQTDGTVLMEKLPVVQEKLSILEEAQKNFSVEQVSDLKEQIDILNQGMQAMNRAIGGEGGLSQNLSVLNQSIQTSFPEAIQGLEDFHTGLEQLGTYQKSLTEGADRLKEASPKLFNGMEQIGTGTEALAHGLDLLGEQLLSGASELTGNSYLLRDGASSLVSGTDTLETGMKQFEREGTDKLKTTVEEEIGAAVERLKLLSSETMSYDNFSGKDQDMEGSVKFVIETEAVE